MRSAVSFQHGGTRTSVPPVERQGLNPLVTHAKHGKPVFLPARAGGPQGKLLGMQVEDTGESEGRPVMGGIGIEGKPDIILLEREQTSGGSLVAREFEEPSERRKANDDQDNGWCASGWEVAWCGITWAEAYGTVRRLQMRIAKVVRKTRTAGSCNKGLCRGLSRMQGNLPVRFLGGGIAAMRSRYPTKRRHQQQAKDADRLEPKRYAVGCSFCILRAHGHHGRR
jgi:hypothetical protein